MIEVLHRSAMARTTTWDSPMGRVRTPAIVFVHTRFRPAPAFAEVRVTADDVPESGVTFSSGGSFFAPASPRLGIPLPATSGLPLHASDVELPARPDSAVVISAERAASSTQIDAEVVLFDHGPEFLGTPRRFVLLLVEVRDAVGPVPLVWIPGLAAPSNLAVLTYCGVDLVDSARMRWDAARGGFHTADGLLPSLSRDPEVCDCNGCKSDDLLLHNEAALARELLVVRQAIRHGTLRDLAERRAMADPWSIAVLRHLDLRAQDFQEPFFPVVGGLVRAYAPSALTRPDVVRFRARVLARVAKPPSARVAVLLPCSARKPYSESASHRRFREAIRRSGRAAAVHEIIVTSPLGIVPREVEVVHPVRAYDVPVTGDWTRDEGHVVSEMTRQFLDRNRYAAVVAHLGPEAPFVEDAAPDAVFTSGSRPRSQASLDKLTRAVVEATDGVEVPSWERRRIEDVANLAAYQFGSAGRDLARGATLRGRPDAVRMFRDGHQLGALTSRGQIALTLAGAEVLLANKTNIVEIEDFHPAGNVFAIGVTTASPEIRIGDEVAVVHASEVRAVGTARMPWREMMEAERGEAVRVRHRALPSRD